MARRIRATAVILSAVARPARRFGRRIAVTACIVAAAAVALSIGLGLWDGSNGARRERRVMLLGIDGMDYWLTRQLMAEGKLPNFSALAEQGTFLPLETTMPPLSPVAWTTFATGMDPGGHGIFDFLRRDPAKVKDGFLPEDSVSRLTVDAHASAWRIPFTRYVWPPRQEQLLLRKGKAFWDILASHRINAVIYKMPANFPVSPSKARTLAGMGTPDIEGSYGTFTYVTDRPWDWTREITGGRILKAMIENAVVKVPVGPGRRALPGFADQ